MTEAELKEIEARADTATPGPWSVTTLIRSGDYDDNEYPLGLSWVPETLTVTDSEGDWSNTPDCEFIAHARTDVPALIAEVRRLQQRLKRYETSLLDEGVEKMLLALHPSQLNRAEEKL